MRSITKTILFLLCIIAFSTFISLYIPQNMYREGFLLGKKATTPIAKPTQQPAANQMQQPAANQMQQPAANQMQQPAATQPPQQTVKPIQQPAANQMQQPAANQMQQPAATQPPQQTVKPMQQQIAAMAAMQRQIVNNVQQQVVNNVQTILNDPTIQQQIAEIVEMQQSVASAPLITSPLITSQVVTTPKITAVTTHAQTISPEKYIKMQKERTAQLLKDPTYKMGSKNVIPK